MRKIQYTVDDDGNRTSVVTALCQQSPQTTSYSTNSLNEYTSVGGTSQSSDANGNLTDNGTRGGTPQSSDPLGNHWTLTGRFHDEEGAGLYYYRARYYDPATGRFFTRDPLGYSEEPGLFAYVGSAPVVVVDPSGLADDCKNGNDGDLVTSA